MTRLPGDRAADQAWSIANERWFYQRPFVYVARASGEGFPALARLLGQPTWRVRAWDERVQRRINSAADFAFPPHPAPAVNWTAVAEREANRRRPPAATTVPIEDVIDGLAATSRAATAGNAWKVGLGL